MLAFCQAGFRTGRLHPAVHHFCMGDFRNGSCFSISAGRASALLFALFCASRLSGHSPRTDNMANGGHLFLGNQNFIANRAVLAFCQAGFRTSRGNCFVDYLRMGFLGNRRVGFCFPLSIRERCPADCTGPMCHTALFHTGWLLRLDRFQGMLWGSYDSLSHQNCPADGTNLSFCQAGARTGCGHRRYNLLCVFCRISFNPGKCEFNISARLRFCFFDECACFRAKVSMYVYLHDSGAVRIKGVARIMLQKVELRVPICKGYILQRITAFKSIRPNVVTIYCHFLQFVAMVKQPISGSNPGITAIHLHILRNMNTRKCVTIPKCTFSRNDRTGTKIDLGHRLAESERIIPQR